MDLPSHISSSSPSSPFSFHPPVLHPHVPPTQIQALPYTKITPHVHIGSINAITPRILEKLQITHVLTLLPPSAHLPDLPQNIIHKRLPLDDNTTSNLLSVLPTACSFIESAISGKNQPKNDEGHWNFRENQILIHCQMGISRSVAVVMGWLMKETGLGRDEALEFVRKRKLEAEGGDAKSKRWSVRPNLGFWRQLGEWEAKLRLESGF